MKARKGAGLTQVKLAGELEVDPVTVSRWERGEVGPNKWLWRALVERFPVMRPFAPEGVLQPIAVETPTGT